MNTFDHPLHLDLTCGHGAFDPLSLPCKELDEFDLVDEYEINETECVNNRMNVELAYCADQLIQNPHPLITRSGYTFVNTYSAAGNEVVERPARQKNCKSSEGGYAK